MCSGRFSKSLASLAETADGLQTVMRKMAEAEYDAERPDSDTGPFSYLLRAQWSDLEVHAAGRDAALAELHAASVDDAAFDPWSRAPF